MVYLNVISVTTTLSSVLAVDVEADVDVVDGGGGGSDLPPVGISPAKIEVDSAHISASAIASRFIDVAPLMLRKMPTYLQKNEWNRMEQQERESCKVG